MNLETSRKRRVRWIALLLVFSLALISGLTQEPIIALAAPQEAVAPAATDEEKSTSEVTAATVARDQEIILAEVKVDGKRGYIDKTGKFVIPALFSETKGFMNGVVAVKKEGKWGYYDKNGKVIVPVEFDEVNDYQDERVTVKRDGKWGCYDKTGKVIMPVQFDAIGKFKEGFAPVKAAKKWGHYDRSGKLAIPMQYSEAGVFSEGLAPIKLDGKWGFIDIGGKVVIPNIYEETMGFNGGLAAIKTKGKWGYIDKNGNIAIPAKFESVSEEFSEGMAAVKVDRKWGYTDKSGGFIAAPFDLVYPFSEGVAEVIVVKTSFSFGGLATLAIGAAAGTGASANLVDANGKRGYIDKSGKVIVPTKYGYAGVFNDGLAIVEIDYKWGAVDKTGAFVIPTQYDWMSAFKDGFLLYYWPFPSSFLSAPTIESEDGSLTRFFPVETEPARPIPRRG